MEKIIFKLFRKQIIIFAEWSKMAEWQDKPKRHFIDNDWNKYIELFLNRKK